MKKRIFTIFLVTLIFFTNLVPVYADGLDDLLDVNLGNYEETIQNDFTGGRNSNPEAEPNSPSGDKDINYYGTTGILKLFLKLVDLILDLIYSALLAIIENALPSMDKIVFNSDGVWGEFFRLSYFDYEYGGSLAGYLVGMVSTIYQVFRYVALIGFVVAIACIAVKMIVAAVGKQKQHYKEAVKNWIIGLLLLVVGHWIMMYMIYFSNFLVDLIVDIKDEAIQFIEKTNAAEVIEGVVAGVAGGVIEGVVEVPIVSGSGVVGNLIDSDGATNPILDPRINFWEKDVTLLSVFRYVIDEMNANALAISTVLNALMIIVGMIVFAVLNFKIAKVYFERVIVVGVLIMIFPIVTVLYAFEKAGLRKASSFETWLKAYVEQVFLQPIHALALMFVIIIIGGLANTPIMDMPIINMVFVIMAMNMTFKIENVITKLIAIHAEGLGSPINPALAAGFAVAAAPGAFKIGGKVLKAPLDFFAGKRLKGTVTDDVKNTKFGKGKLRKWASNVRDNMRDANGRTFTEALDHRITTSDTGQWIRNKGKVIKKAMSSDYAKSMFSGALAVGGLHPPMFYGSKGGAKANSGIKELKVSLEALNKAEKALAVDSNNRKLKEARDSAFREARFHMDNYLGIQDADLVKGAKKELNIINPSNAAEMAALLDVVKNPESVHNIYDKDGNINYDRASAEVFDGAKTFTAADAARYNSISNDTVGAAIIADELETLKKAFGDAFDRAMASAGFDSTADVCRKEDLLRLVYALRHPGNSHVKDISDDDIEENTKNLIKG